MNYLNRIDLRNMVVMITSHIVVAEHLFNIGVLG